MERLYNLPLFASQRPYAIRALQVTDNYLKTNGRSDDHCIVTAAIAVLEAASSDMFLLTETEITAILNGIAILAQSKVINLYAGNNSDGEQFRRLKYDLIAELQGPKR